MYRLALNGVKVPEIWVAENEDDIKEFKRINVNEFYVAPKGFTKRMMFGAVLWSMLRKKFPHIDWGRELGIYSYTQKIEHHVRKGTEDRTGGGGGHNSVDETCLTSEGEYRTASGDYIKKDISVANWSEMVLDENLVVDVEELRKLDLLPKFIGDISSACSAFNGYSYRDGYNKKLGLCFGSYDASRNKPNLLIVDVSSSIPRGIAETLISLLETMRFSADADLIVTGGHSMYYPSSMELPPISDIKHAVYFQGGNETYDFYMILKDHIFGKSWGNVIVFGDSDSPAEIRFWNKRHADEGKDIPQALMDGTEIENLKCYSTTSTLMGKPTGYARWAWDYAKERNTTWDWVLSMT